ncbi:PAS domain-containing sensor histidine kinase [Arcticibacter eurypsychrophilus]|uniref:PAS domain-containing sensor histidine kinase n=1 Tax=Arcticibacter eurypsychrophilus TaxID=1434752 RepID=UPI00084D1432|nr:PAS domain-containing sensor histidine kinase [Arcticibacter eurypsychrophilus]
METKTLPELIAIIYELRAKLNETQNTIDAIFNGEIDALVVPNKNGHQLYTLKNADRNYRVIVENMTQGALTLDSNGVILYSNSRFASLLNFPLEHVIGVPFENFVPDEFKAAFRRLLNKGWRENIKDDLYLMGKNFERIPFLLSLTKLEFDKGEVISIILTDLSLIIETENQLKAKNIELEKAQYITAKLNKELKDTVKEKTRDLLISQRNFKFLADNIPVMVWTADRDGKFDYFNQQWLDYTGLSVDDSKNDGWMKVVHLHDIKASMESWQAALATSMPLETMCRIRKIDSGEYLWHLTKAIPFFDENSRIIAWFGTMTNIEEQKQALAKKDEFIGIASHELKTPLTSLKGYMQLISAYKQNELPPIIKQFAGKANEAIGKLANLVNDLLDVSKIQMGKLEFNTSLLNVSDLIQLCIESAQFMYPNYIISVHGKKNGIVTGNMERLEQVMMNLISNAVKYSPVNKEIDIETEVTETEVKVSIKDFGIGLSDHQKERIFERFYRVEDNTYSTSGLGIGLYISSEIIKAHNGKIGVMSKLNKGSTFYFILPIHE